MRFRFVVEAEVERDEGKFASRDELGEQLKEAIEAADPSVINGDNGGIYSVSSWDVTDESETRAR